MIGFIVAIFYRCTDPVSGTIVPDSDRRHPRPAEPLGPHAAGVRIPVNSAAAAEQTAAAAPPSAQERRNAKVIDELLSPYKASLYLLIGVNDS